MPCVSRQSAIKSRIAVFCMFNGMRAARKRHAFPSFPYCVRSVSLVLSRHACLIACGMMSLKPQGAAYDTTTKGKQTMNTTYATKPDIIDLYNQSTAIDLLAYDYTHHALYVEWVNGSVYRYDCVLPDVVADACSAHSLGKFINLNVKDSYPCDYTCQRGTAEYQRLFG